MMYLKYLDPQLPPYKGANYAQFIASADLRRANDIALELWDWLGRFIGPTWGDIWERIETDAWDIIRQAQDSRSDRKIPPLCIDGKHAFKPTAPFSSRSNNSVS